MDLYVVFKNAHSRRRRPDQLIPEKGISLNKRSYKKVSKPCFIPYNLLSSGCFLNQRYGEIWLFYISATSSGSSLL